MTTKKSALAALLLALPSVLPFAAQAVSSAEELRYCRALGDTYVRYVSPAETSSGVLARRLDVEAGVALAKCQTGDASAAIPILERKLMNAGFSLPLRD